MNESYHDLLQEDLENNKEFQVGPEGDLSFHGIDLHSLVKSYGSPLKISYLPIISEQIQKAKNWFHSSFEDLNYKGKYYYCYCTKSSHFSFVMDEVLKNDVHIETSSAYDLPIVRKLFDEGKLSKDQYIICNGFKRPEYLRQINKMLKQGYTNVIPVLDNESELKAYANKIDAPVKIGIRIATEEIPNFSFYTSRLGINPNQIFDLFQRKIQGNKQFSLKMLHFFINTGIKDHVYYWNELDKCLKLYAQLKKLAPELDSLNIGGGLPFKTHLQYEYDYQGFIEKIIQKIHQTCEEEGIPEPDIFTEFGTFTVAESGAVIYKVLDQKQQNDRELWYMLNNSFMTTVPDIWGIDQRFIVLPINRWKAPYKPVFLGGLTCDSMDFYNNEVHNNKLFMPTLSKKEPLYIGLFNTGAYQDLISGYGGLKHCLIPSPKYVVVDRDEKGEVKHYEFKKEQSANQMLKILGYNS